MKITAADMGTKNYAEERLHDARVVTPIEFGGTIRFDDGLFDGGEVSIRVTGPIAGRIAVASDRALSHDIRDLGGQAAAIFRALAELCEEKSRT